VSHIIAKIVLSEGTRQQNAALCGGNHPANYTGCEHYHNIIEGNNPYRSPPERSIPIPTSAYNHAPPPHSLTPQQQRSYADVVSNRAQPAVESIITLKGILEDFKGLFAQLIQQNSLILNMLTTILNEAINGIAKGSVESKRPPTT